MYGNVYEDEERFESQAVFPKLLSKQAADFSWVNNVWQRIIIIATCNINMPVLLLTLLRVPGYMHAGATLQYNTLCYIAGFCVEGKGL